MIKLVYGIFLSLLNSFDVVGVDWVLKTDDQVSILRVCPFLS